MRDCVSLKNGMDWGPIVASTRRDTIDQPWLVY